MEIPKFVPLKPEIVQRILDQRIDEHETQQWVGEALEVEETKKKVRYLLLTEICLYVIDKSFKQRRTYSLLDFLSISTTSDSILIDVSNKKYHFILPDSAALMTNVFLQLRKLSYALSSTQLGLISPICRLPEFQSQPVITKRPPNLLLTRYLSSCISKNIQPDQFIMEEFIKYDEDPQCILRLVNSELVDSVSAMFCLTLECYIRNISLDNFSPNIFGSTLSWILTSENRFQSLDLYHYDNADFTGIIDNRSPFNKVRIIRFHYCSTAFVTNFLFATRAVNYTIDTIIFDNIQFDQECSSLLIHNLQKVTFFSALKGLAFLSCSYIGTPFCNFANQCIQSSEKLETFTADNCDIDVCNMLLEIIQNDVKIQHISLRKNFGKTVIRNDDLLISNSTLTVDVGECEWTEESLISFISSICRKLRRSPLALILDHTNIEDEWSEIFERLPIESYMPILTELNISWNKFDDRAFSLFLNFLETQSPIMSISKTKLMHLNISHCFGENVDANLKKLLTFFSKRELWGLEICGCPPTPELIEITGLHALNIGDNDFDRTSINNLNRFINDSTTISELGLNNIRFQDVKAMMQFYTNILAHSKILAFSPLKSLYTEYGTYPETQHIKDFLSNKRKFSTTVQRISLFLGLAGDFSTYVSKSLQLTEVDQSVAEGSRPSSLLINVDFKKGVQSLFTLATKSNVDVSVDPVAGMVAEYVATSGRYGIVPPTAPPTEPPNTEFLMPSIFATMTTKNEIEGNDDSTFQDFDPLNEENQKISMKLAEMLKAKCRPLNPAGSPDFWNNSKNAVSFKTIQIPNL